MITVRIPVVATATGEVAGREEGLNDRHAGLDQTGRDLVDALIGDSVAAGGTVVVSSHELERVAALSPRTVTLAGGAVVGGPSSTGGMSAAGGDSR